MNPKESQQRKEYVKFIIDRISDNKYVGYTFSNFISRPVNIKKHIEQFIEWKDNITYNEQKASELYYNFKPKKTIDEDLHRKLYKALNFKSAPEDSTLHSFQVLFSNGFFYNEFCSKLENENIKFSEKIKIEINSSNISDQNSITKNDSITKENPLLEIIPFDKLKGNYDILILPFRNPDDNFKITNLGEVLKASLNDKNEIQKLGYEIRYESYPTHHISFEEAKEIGEKYEADIVIWGDDSKLDKQTSHVIYFNYVNTTKEMYSEFIPLTGKTNTFEIERLIYIKSGNLHLEIEDIIYWFLGNKYYFNYNFSNALSSFEKIENLRFQNDELYAYKAYCYSELKLFNKAIENFKKAIDCKPSSNLLHFSYANILFENTDQIKNAQYHYERAIKLNNKFEEAHFNLATLLAESKKNYKGSKRNLERAIEINPNNYKSHYNLAYLLEKYLKNPREAQRHYDTASELNQFCTKNNFICFELLSEIMHEMKESKVKLEKENEDILNNWEVQLFSALYTYKIGYVHETFFKISEEEIYADGLNYYGILNEKLFKNIKVAEKYYKRALEIRTNFAEAHFNYANLLLNYNLSTLEIVESHYIKALENNHNYSDAHYNYANLLYVYYEKRKEEARMHFEKALKIAPNIAEINFNYAAFMLDKYDDDEKAKLYYHKAIQLNPKFKTKENDKYFGVK